VRAKPELKMQITTNLYPSLYPALNVAEIDIVEGAAGPGRRFVIWLQGCLKRCDGCANGPFLTKQVAHVYEVAELLNVLSTAGECDGVTLSGGEPVLQARALLPFLKAIRERRLTVMCYTGYQLAELAEQSPDPILNEFLSYIDLLVDGEYQAELGRAGVYRPTSNQRLHFISNRITPESCTAPVETVFNLTGGRAVVTGTLPDDLRRQLMERLRQAGVVLNNR
jgi:anaerobic ribonucleoside-triphosphate reductase activating protein